MPIIKILQTDLDRAKQPDAGWDHYQLVEVTEKASKGKDSVNYNFDFQCDKEGSKNHGRHIYNMCNTKAIGMGLFPMTSALLNIPLDELKPTDLDTDGLLKKGCWIEVVDETYEGKIMKRCGSFSPDTRPPF